MSIILIPYCKVDSYHYDCPFKELHYRYYYNYNGDTIYMCYYRQGWKYFYHLKDNAIWIRSPNMMPSTRELNLALIQLNMKYYYQGWHLLYMLLVERCNGDIMTHAYGILGQILTDNLALGST